MTTNFLSSNATHGLLSWTTSQNIFLMRERQVVNFPPNRFSPAPAKMSRNCSLCLNSFGRGRLFDRWKTYWLHSENRAFCNKILEIESRINVYEWNEAVHLWFQTKKSEERDPLSYKTDERNELQSVRIHYKAYGKEQDVYTKNVEEVLHKWRTNISCHHHQWCLWWIKVVTKPAAPIIPQKSRVRKVFFHFFSNPESSPTPWSLGGLWGDLF